MITLDIMTPQPELGKTCREIREEHNLSVLDFADLVGFTRQAVYNFENGKTASMGLLLAYVNLAKGGNNESKDN